MASYDIAIIGAGVHGASAAFHLADRGARVVVLERTTPAGGPTGRSSAVVRTYYTNPFLAAVARDSVQMFATFAELTGGGDCGFRNTGSMFLHPAEQAEQVRRHAAQLNALGIAAESLTAQDLRTALPGFELGDIAIGVWEPQSGYADPAGTTQGLIAAAVRGGVTLLQHTPVRRIVPQPDHVELVTDGEPVRADRVLVAAGPWTGPLLLGIGVDLPLTVERHVVAAYELSATQTVTHVVADLVGGYYFKPEGHGGHFQLGPLEEAPQVDPHDFEEQIAPDESLELAERAVRRMPALADAQDRGGWASLYDVSPDWQPVIGQVAERVYVDAGTSGHGFKLAPALGRHVADLVSGTDIDPGLKQFDPARFASADGMLCGGFGDSSRILG